MDLGTLPGGVSSSLTPLSAAVMQRGARLVGDELAAVDELESMARLRPADAANANADTRLQTQVIFRPARAIIVVPLDIATVGPCSPVPKRGADLDNRRRTSW